MIEIFVLKEITLILQDLSFDEAMEQLAYHNKLYTNLMIMKNILISKVFSKENVTISRF